MEKLLDCVQESQVAVRVPLPIYSFSLFSFGVDKPYPTSTVALSPLPPIENVAMMTVVTNNCGDNSKK